MGVYVRVTIFCTSRTNCSNVSSQHLAVRDDVLLPLYCEWIQVRALFHVVSRFFCWGIMLNMILNKRSGMQYVQVQCSDFFKTIVEHINCQFEQKKVIYETYSDCYCQRTMVELIFFCSAKQNFQRQLVSACLQRKHRPQQSIAGYFRNFSLGCLLLFSSKYFLSFHFYSCFSSLACLLRTYCSFALNLINSSQVTSEILVRRQTPALQTKSTDVFCSSSRMLKFCVYVSRPVTLGMSLNSIMVHNFF